MIDAPLDKVPRIRCAVCDKPVDRFEITGGNHAPGMLIQAFCHGKRDQMFLTASFIQNLRPEEFKAMNSGLIEGVAFREEAILLLSEGDHG